MDRSTNIDSSFFLFLLKSNAELLGLNKTKEQLEKIGEDIANNLVRRFPVTSLSAKTFKEFKEKRNPLTEFDRTLEINDDMIFLIDNCPFEDAIHAYLDIVGEMPPVLLDLIKSYNDERAENAISPYCILHQTLRKALSKSIKIGGKACDVLQLGCKGSKGKIALSQKNIAIAAITNESVEAKLQSAACAYMVQRKRST